MTLNNIPQGYKATALGIIPQEWEVKTLGNIAEINPSKGKITSKVVTFLAMSDISEQGGVINENILPIDSIKPGLTPFRKGDVIIAKITPCFENGKGALLDKITKDDGFGSTEFHVIRCQQDNKFVYYHTQSYAFRKRLESQMTGSAGQKRVPADSVAAYKIAVPPLAEQRKIAEVLGVWDEAIEKQARLIEKLALRKRALMQRLLSAKLRLPGFSEPWEKVKLGDIGHFLSSNTLSRDCLNEQIGNIKNIHYGDILIKLPTIVDASFIHIPYVNDDVIVKSDYLKNGDIIFADTAEDYTVGKAIEIINIQAIPVTSGLHTIPFRPKSGIFVNRFLGYYVNSTDYRRQLQPLIQGIKVYSISKTALCKTTLKIPTLSEQTAIAEVLTAADREIELAKEKLERLRRQKRGLMQQLLTGKKRVKY